MQWESRMGLTGDELRQGLEWLAVREPGIASGLARHGWPEPRIRARGHQTLMRTILGQQVSVVSADATWRRLRSITDDEVSPAAILAASDAALREAGLSRQKASYLRHLSQLVAAGELDLRRLPADDEAAIAALTRVKGIGRWSAEIYLLFAEGRADIWPAGDLAVQVETGLLLGLPHRPGEPETRRLAEGWRPHRGAAAVFAWHHYTERLAAGGPRQPL
jgi:DNA-3-methyladenine glycosylase II